MTIEILSQLIDKNNYGFKVRFGVRRRHRGPRMLCERGSVRNRRVVKEREMVDYCVQQAKVHFYRVGRKSGKRQMPRARRANVQERSTVLNSVPISGTICLLATVELLH